MKREARILLGKAVDSLILSIERFNCPWDRGRVDGVLITLDHSFEMLLKASIIHRGGNIREKGAKNTIGFDACVRKGLSDGDIKFLNEEQALTLQSINSLRDAAQHHHLDISEDHLYLHAQAGLTLFRDLMLVIYNRDLAAELPERVLPIATKVPTNLINLFEQQVEEVRRLLAPGKRRGTEARAKLRSLAIVENALRGEKLQPDESDLRRMETRIRNGEDLTTLFPGVASINLVATGEGPSLCIRLTKQEGVPVQLVKEGTPDASVVAVKRVNELDFYILNHKQLSQKVGLTANKTTAMIWHLRLKGNLDFHKQFSMGKSKFDRYSQKAITAIQHALQEKSAQEYWDLYYGEKMKEKWDAKK